MGNVNWHDVGAYSSGQLESGDLQDVAAAAIWRDMSVTFVESRGGRLSFVQEIPMRQGTPLRVDPATGCSIFRLEVKVRTASAPIKAGYHLVVAGHPYGNGFVASCPFRVGRHRKREVIEDGLGDVQPLAHEPWTRDPWETGNALTAGIGFPPQPRRVRGALRDNSRAILIFGVVEDFERALGELRRSPEVLRLHRLTQERAIPFSLRVRPEALSESTLGIAPSLLDLAMHQALAGPREDVERWLDRPVTDLVERIYCDELNNYNRRRSFEIGRDTQAWSDDE